MHLISASSNYHLVKFSSIILSLSSTYSQEDWSQKEDSFLYVFFTCGLRFPLRNYILPAPTVFKEVQIRLLEAGLHPSLVGHRLHIHLCRASERWKWCWEEKKDTERGFRICWGIGGNSGKIESMGGKEREDDHQRAGASPLWRQAERDGVAEPRES